jgi:uncharacterized protein YbjT (DUF2867 family)
VGIHLKTDSPEPAEKTIGKQTILLTGASGYVGGRLLPLLSRHGRHIRCLIRKPELAASLLGESIELVKGDVLDRQTLDFALRDVTTAYYLVHLMASRDFQAKDREAAHNFAAAAKQAGVQRIIYLGGLGDDSDPKLSIHLRSRHEVGTILRASGVEVIEFRASVIIGGGSLSFEMISSLTKRLPVMICPQWLATPTQPIAIDDVLRYLLAALELPTDGSRIFEIGGPDVTTYGALIREYARQKGLRRWLISVPLLTPYLSSLWLGLVTPASADVGRHLIEGLKNPTIVTNTQALDDFPIRPVGIRLAMRRAIEEPSK